MAWPTKIPKRPPDTSPEAMKSRTVHTRKLDALRQLRSLDDLEPVSRRAIEMWADGAAWAVISSETRIAPARLSALRDSPAAKAYLQQRQHERDAERVRLAAAVPWVELWRSLQARKPGG